MSGSYTFVRAENVRGVGDPHAPFAAAAQEFGRTVCRSLRWRKPSACTSVAADISTAILRNGRPVRFETRPDDWTKQAIHGSLCQCGHSL